MRMAIEATGPQDPEGLAWAWSQLGALHLQQGHIDEASRAYDRALFAFPRHPYALAGQARVAAIRGDLAQALRGYRDLLAQAPTPELAAHVGDLLFRRGDLEGASSQWAYAERLEREGWKDEAPQPGALARLLAERDLQPPEALRLAREAAAGRDDIFTNDTLAWALYRTGAFEQAWAASERARRTGTRDRRILYHAAAIAAARGDRASCTRAHGHPGSTDRGAARGLHPEFDRDSRHAGGQRRCLALSLRYGLRNGPQRRLERLVGEPESQFLRARGHDALSRQQQGIGHLAHGEPQDEGRGAEEARTSRARAPASARTPRW